MKPVWSIADCIVSPLGFSTEENYQSIKKGISGISLVNDASLCDFSFLGSQIKSTGCSDSLTRFEKVCLKALEGALHNITLPPNRTLFILSTTKGNIDQLRGDSGSEKIALHETAKFLADQCGFKNHLVVSNACISGVLALIVAKRFISSGDYDHAVVLGADVLSHFVASGFESLHALSATPCQPFDVNRTGLNLGEAAAAIILSAKPGEVTSHYTGQPPPAIQTGARPNTSIEIKGEGLSNDANHISGPSRTGEELAFAIDQALKNSGCTADEIDFISAHGTATLYNDEMEAKAFSLAGMESIPLNSLKGYYGHTLGAAGIVETVISIHSLLNNELIPTAGFQTVGVSKKINVIDTWQSKPMRRILKTASGFGGCNAALVIEKV